MYFFSMVCRQLPVVLVLLAASLVHAGEDGPEIVRVEPIDRDYVAVVLHAGHIRDAGGQQPYIAQAQDKLVKWRDMTWINRDGRDFASLVGPGHKLMYVCSTVAGKPLDTIVATNPHNITLTTAQGQSMQPVKVYRKSEPLQFVRTALHVYDSTMTHQLYLQWPKPLKEGEKYTLSIANHVPAIAAYTYVHQPRLTQSPAVHVTQVGFKPGDPKAGFVSMWLGDGGAYGYQVSRPFELIDDVSNKTVFTGKLALSKAASDNTEDFSKRNYNGTDVYLADFSACKTPGQYRLFVDGVGCSYPFAIDEHVWDKPFITAVRGLYHQRSGIELKEPCTDFKRPRPHHPDDGVIIHQSNLMYMDPNSENTQTSRFKGLVEQATDKTVPNVWGGYMDAGDWDRRIDHLRVSHLLFELFETYPDRLGKVNLNIPESANNLPDLLDEALFNLDFYRRMQRRDGAVSGGVEAEEHPIYGEASWQDSLKLYQFAPGPYASFTYAACAAHASIVLEKLDPAMASTYLQSAQNAMDWAMKQMATGKFDKLGSVVNDTRNLAALMLYRKTKDARWHDEFARTTAFKDKQWHVARWQQFDQTDAAYYYLILSEDQTDAALRRNIQQALIATADRLVAAGQATAFRWTGDPGAGVGWGKLTVPQATNLLRVYRLTGQSRYYESAVNATQFGTGANPGNLCYTTGVGTRWPTGVLHVDAERTHQHAPYGLTVMGPMDIKKQAGYWPFKFAGPFIYPAWQTWPTTEAFWDVPIMAHTNEYTVHKTLAPNLYVWGHLAGMD